MRRKCSREAGARPARLYLLAAILLFACPAGATVTVNYVFVAPTATINANFPGGTYMDGLTTGYRGVTISPQNLAVFQAQAPPNMLRTYNALQPGTALRAQFDAVTQLNGGITDEIILLVDDRTGLTSDGIFATGNINGRRAVWPAASVVPVNAGRYRGLIRLGELGSGQIQTWPGNWLAWEGAILHEANHTQFVGEKTKWGTITITYGGDGTHYIDELLGDQELPLEEGLGNYFATVHNDPAGSQQVDILFSRTDARYMIESRSVLAGTAEVWDAPHHQVERPVTDLADPAAHTGQYFWRQYRWWNMPGRYLLFAESTSQGFHNYFWRQVNGNRDQALAMIKTAVGNLWRDRQKRYLTYDVNRLALEMERFAGTADGQTAHSAGRLTSSMFPFALLDLLTHFGMTEQQYRQDYDRHYPDRQPRAYTEYWRRRQAVRDLAMPMLQSSPIRMRDAVAAVARYFQDPSTILTETP